MQIKPWNYFPKQRLIMMKKENFIIARLPKDSFDRKKYKWVQSVLVKLFCYQNSLRSEIINHLLSSIMFSTDDQVAFAAAIVGQLLKNFPDLVDNYAERIKDMIDYVAYLKPNNVNIILLEMKPIFQRKKDLLEYLFLSLRKCVFQKDIRARQVAVNGYLTIIQDISTTIALDVPEAVGFLRRAKSQQLEVRRSLYRSLTQAVKQSRENFIVSVALHIVLPLLRSYIDHENAPYLKLHCFSSTTGDIIEPFADILRCAYEIEEWIASSVNSEAQQNMRTLLEVYTTKNIARCISTCTLEDFELDKESEVIGDTIEAQMNRSRVTLLIEITDILLYRSFHNTLRNDVEAKSHAVAILKMRNQLLDMYKKFPDFHPRFIGTKKKVSKKEPEGEQKTSTKVISSTLTIDSSNSWGFENIISSFKSISTSLSQSQSATFNDDEIILASDFLHQEFRKQMKSLQSVNSNLGINHYKTLSKAVSCFMREFKEFRQFEGCLKLAVRSLDAVYLCFEKIEMTDDSLKLDSLEVLCDVMIVSKGSSPDGANPIQRITESLRGLQQLASSSIEDQSFKEAEYALKIIFLISKSLTSICNTLKDDGIQEAISACILQICIWATNTLSNMPIKELLIVKYLGELSCALAAFLSDFSHIEKITLIIYNFLGNINEGHYIEEAEIRFGNSITNIRNVNGSQELVPAIIFALSSKIKESKWLLSRNLALDEYYHLLEKDLERTSCTDSDFDAMQQVFSSNMLDVAFTLNILFKVAFSKWNSTVSLLTICEKFYNILGEFTRQQKAMGLALGKSFIQLVQFSNKYLTQQFYAFVLFLNAKESAGEIPTMTKLQRESKLIPNIIYSIENFEAQILQLSIANKAMNLVAGMKRSAARDYIISEDQLSFPQERADHHHDDAARTQRETQERERTNTSQKRRKKQEH